jgi:hypothetical protein
MVEPPTNTMTHLPGLPEDEFSDFTHRDYRPDHVANPTPRGIPYDPFMSPQQAGRILVKVARKSRNMVKGRRVGGGKATVKTGTAHGRK